MSDVFISYSRTEGVFADKLASALEKDDRTVWIDRARIELTSEWWEEIKRGIEASDNFVLIMSPASMASPVCHLEIEYARQLTKRIIPIYHIAHDYEGTKEHFGGRLYKNDKDGFLLKLYGDRNPMLVFEENWNIIPGINRIEAPIKTIESDPKGIPTKIDEADFQTFFPSLRKALDTDIEHVHQQTYLFNRTRDWLKKGRKTSDLLNGVETQEAEEWLQNWETDKANRQARGLPAKDPQPNDDIRAYIIASREAETERIRRLQELEESRQRSEEAARHAQEEANKSDKARKRARQTLFGVAVLSAILIITTLIFTNNQVEIAQEQVNIAATQAANAELREAQAVTAVADGQATLEAVNTHVAIVQVTVTQAAIVQEIISGFADTLLQQRDNPSGQVAQANRLIELYPDQALAWHARGLIYSEQDEYELAIADFDRAIELDLQNANFFNSRGATYRNLGEVELAIADFERAIEIQPRNANFFHSRGIAYSDLGETGQAIADFDRAIELQPEFVGAFNNRGVAYSDLGETERAIADFGRVIDLDPQYAEAFNNRGNAYKLLGEYERAIADFDRAIELDPQLAEAFYNRGVAYSDLGEFEQAIANYDRAIELDPQDDKNFNNRGVAYSDLGEFEQAIANYDRAIELNSQYAEAFNNRGVAYSDLGEFEQAIANYDRAIELNSQYAEAFYNRSVAYSDLGEFEQAIANYDRAIELDPQLAEAFYNRGVAYSDLGEIERAIADFDRAIELNSQYAEAFNNRGVAYARLDEYEQAIGDFNYVIQLNPQDAEAFSNRGIVYYLWSLDIRSAILDRRLEYQKQALADWQEAERLGHDLPRTVREIRAEVEAELGVSTSESSGSKESSIVDAGVARRGDNRGSMPIGAFTLWIYSAQAGETLTITTVAEWDTTLFLLNSDGDILLAENDDTQSLPNPSNSQIIYTFDQAGEYLIPVGSFESRSGGNYVLRIEVGD